MRVRRTTQGFIADAGKSPVTGRRERRRFTTRAEADQWLNQKRSERNREGYETLTPEQRLDAMLALKLLEGRATLTEAARSWMDAIRESPDASKALTAFLLAKRGLNRRERTIAEIRQKVGRMVEELGDRPVSGYSADDIDAFLSGFTPSSRNQYMTVLGGFFRWCVKRGHLASSPVNVLDKSSVDQRPTSIHTPDEVMLVLSAARQVNPAMLGWYALGYFCGIRSSELECVKWCDIMDGNVFVAPEVAKKRRQRWVPVPECGAAWLALAGKQAGALAFSRKDHRSIVKQAGVTWPRNVMRHSFGSYHLAMTGNAAETAVLMGHTDTSIIYDHYRNPVIRDQAHEFFSVFPQRETARTRSSAQAVG